MKVDAGTLKRIRELRQKRRHAAFVVGVAWFEFMEAWQSMRGKVEKWKAEERVIAETALRKLGIDLEKVDAAIDEDTGVVQIRDRRTG